MGFWQDAVSKVTGALEFIGLRTKDPVLTETDLFNPSSVSLPQRNINRLIQNDLAPLLKTPAGPERDAALMRWIDNYDYTRKTGNEEGSLSKDRSAEVMKMLSRAGYKAEYANPIDLDVAAKVGNSADFAAKAIGYFMHGVQGGYSTADATEHHYMNFTNLRNRENVASRGSVETKTQQAAIELLVFKIQGNFDTMSAADKVSWALQYQSLTHNRQGLLDTRRQNMMELGMQLATKDGVLPPESGEATSDQKANKVIYDMVCGLQKGNNVSLPTIQSTKQLAQEMGIATTKQIVTGLPHAAHQLGAVQNN